MSSTDTSDTSDRTELKVQHLENKNLDNDDPLYVAAEIPRRVTGWDVELICFNAGFAFDGYDEAVEHLSQAFRTGEATAHIHQGKAETLHEADRLTILDSLVEITEDGDDNFPRPYEGDRDASQGSTGLLGRVIGLPGRVIGLPGRVIPDWAH